MFGVTEGLIFLPTEFALEATTVRLVNEPGDRLVRLPLDEPLRAAIADLSRPLPWKDIEAQVAFVPFAAQLARAAVGVDEMGGVAWEAGPDLSRDTVYLAGEPA